MGKMVLFSILWWLTGSPFVALLIILLLLYVLDLRFVRLLPDIAKPYRRWRRLSSLKNQLRLNPHGTSAKLEVARLLMEKRQFSEALSYLDEISSVMEDSPEYLCDICPHHQWRADFLRAFGKPEIGCRGHGARRRIWRTFCSQYCQGCL